LVFEIGILNDGGATDAERAENYIWFNLIKVSEREEAGQDIGVENC
jgi:hypothetical protein